MAALSFLALTLALQSAAADQEAPPVGLELLSTARGVVPGEPFEVAARFQLPAEWHIYWENPGESGLATSAELKAPPGFEVEGPFFPAPVRMVGAGGIVSYGYAGEAVLFFRVRPPQALLPQGNVRLSVAADWLICKEACHVGRGEAALELPLAARPAPPRALPALEEARKRLPRPWSELASTHATWTRGAASSACLQVRVEGARELEFFPLESEGVEFVREEAVAGSPEALRLHYRLDADPAARARGVLRVTRGATTTWHTLDQLAPDGPAPKKHP